MLKSGTAKRSSSSWSAALHLVHKKEDQWRPCNDYRAFKNRTVTDRYPFTDLQDFAQMISNKTTPLHLPFFNILYIAFFHVNVILFIILLHYLFAYFIPDYSILGNSS